jgi:hypothetical protein
MKSQIPNSYSAMIQQATGAADELLPVLERIMREDVFHSTLDWQTRSEFNRGAKKAHAIYLADAAFHDADMAMRRASFELSKAEYALNQARSSGEPPMKIAESEKQLESAKIAERKASLAFESFLSPLSHSL